MIQRWGLNCDCDCDESHYWEDPDGDMVTFADHEATVRELLERIRENLYEPDKIICIIDRALGQ